MESDELQVVPPAPPVDSSSAWFHRTPFEERKTKLRVHPISSDGMVQITFSKSVPWPDNIREQILADKLLNVTFQAKKYDSEAHDEQMDTSLESWEIQSISSHDMWL